MEIVETQEGGADLALPPLLIRKPLEEYFDRQGLGSGPIEAERIGEGHSNVTFLIERGDDRFVLRRPPLRAAPPPAPADSAVGQRRAAGGAPPHPAPGRRRAHARGARRLRRRVR